MNKVALVLEGGGSKGAFTVGAIECLLKNGIEFPYVIGVSAGSMNAVNFVSGQVSRGKEATINIMKDNDVVSVKNVLKNKSIIDLELLFDKIPNEIVPLDYDTYFNSKTHCLITVTNVETGRPEYIEEKSDKNRLMQILRASMSLPYFMPIVEIDGKKYMDGGISDSIPFKKAYNDGYRKQVVILTKNFGYRKTLSSISRNTAILFYSKYPQFVKSIVKRHLMYNKQIEKIEELEKDGKIIVIRPLEDMETSRLEKDVEKLNNLYSHGYDVTNKMMDKIKDFINEK